MNETSCEYPSENPALAVCFETTGNDYGKFLSGLMTSKAISKEIVEASEKNMTPFMSKRNTMYGDYGFGHFLFCFDSP
jgi:hypothetical protein